MDAQKIQDRDKGYVREVRAERWLNVTASAWLVAIALLLAGWLVVVALRYTGIDLFDLAHHLP